MSLSINAPASTRNRLLQRLRITAFPTLLDTVIPTRERTTSEFSLTWRIKKPVRTKIPETDARTKSSCFRIMFLLLNGKHYADKRARPLDLLALSTRPPAAVRARNPCLRFLTILPGLYVGFPISTSQNSNLQSCSRFLFREQYGWWSIVPDYFASNFGGIRPILF